MSQTEEQKAKMSNMEPASMVMYDGVYYPPFPTMRVKGVEQAMSDVQKFEFRKSDILICTYGKSGTHWINEIISMLVNNTTELSEETKSSFMLETLVDFNETEQRPSPRILNSHLQFQYLAKKHVSDGGKIVHMIRNPKDICVSLFNFLTKIKMLKDFTNITWNEFFEKWIDDKVPYGSWYDYELGFEQAEKDYPEQIYTLSYEDVKRNNIEELQKLAAFLGVNRTDEIINQISTATNFENMQLNKKDDTKNISRDGKGFIFRKGEVGDWKNWLTVRQNEIFDRQYQEKIKTFSYNIQFV